MEQLEFTEDKISAGIFCKNLSDIHNASNFAVSTFVDPSVASYDGDIFFINEIVVSKIFAKLCSILKTKWPSIKINVFFKKGIVTSEDVSFAILIIAQNSQISQSAVQFLVNNFKSSELAWKQKSDFLIDFNSESTFFDCEFDSSVESLFPDEPEVIKVSEDAENDIPSHLVQIQASKDEVAKRINQFLEGKRDLINKHNESFYSLVNTQDSCSRVNPVRKRQRNVLGHDNKLLSRCMDDGK